MAGGGRPNWLYQTRSLNTRAPNVPKRSGDCSSWPDTLMRSIGFWVTRGNAVVRHAKRKVNYICNVCSTDHFLRCNPPYWWQCHKFFYKIAVKDFKALRKHINAVHEKDAVVCPICEKNISRYRLPQHIREMHENKEPVNKERTIPCDREGCNYKTHRLVQLKLEIRAFEVQHQAIFKLTIKGCGHPEKAWF